MVDPFPFPTPLETRLLREMSDVAALCYDRGWTWGTAGNFSIRGHHDIIWQSPSGLCKGALRPEQFVAVDLSTEKPLQLLLGRASLEFPVHAGIYKSTSARTVVHGHPPAVVQLSKDKEQYNFDTEEMTKALGLSCHSEQLMIVIGKNPTTKDMRSCSPYIATLIKAPAQVVVLAGHGVWAWGKTPMEALGYIEALEFLCRSAL